MASLTKRKLSGRQRRKVRVRKKILGSATKPRLSVFRSAKHISAQVIDDDGGKTLAAVSTIAKGNEATGTKREQAKHMGFKLGAMCKENNISTVVFDRNGYRYHGRVKELADGAREAGLQF